MKKRLALILAAALVLTSSLTACSGNGGSAGSSSSTGDKTAGNTPAAGGSEIAVCIGPDPETIDPALNSAVDGASLILHNFENLLTIDQNGQVVPGQAESYEPSEDGLTWTFKLRSGLKWSDGTPLTAADFEYSWKRAVAPETAAPYADMYSVIAGYKDAINGNFDGLQVKATDDLTLTVTLANPCAYFTQLCAFPAFAPVQKATIEANGESWATDAKTYIGNGPYMVSEWTPGEFIKMVKNPNYWNVEKLGSDTIKFVLMEDPNAILSAYQNNAIVVAKDIPGQEVPKLRETPDFALDDMLGTYYISFNLEKAPFDNPDVRMALSLAIDRKYMAETVMQGTYAPAGNLIGPGLLDADGKTQFYDNSEKFINIDDHEGNLVKAKELLAKAGYPDGQGLPKIEYMINEASYHKPVAEALQQMWGKIGVQMSIQLVEWQVMTPNRREGNYEVARNGWICDYNDPSTMLELFTTGNGNNDGRYSNANFDEQMNIARSTDDQEKRFTAMHAAEKQIMDDAGMAPVAYYQEFYLKNPKLKGFWHSPTGFFHFMYATMEE